MYNICVILLTVTWVDSSKGTLEERLAMGLLIIAIVLFPSITKWMKNREEERKTTRQN